jgi:hypothetical protein
MATTWISPLKKNGNGRLFAAAAWIESVSDRLPRDGSPGCNIRGGDTGHVNISDAYASVKATLTSAFVEFDSLESTEVGKPAADRMPTFKGSVNSALVEEVRPLVAGWSTLIFSSGHELVVSGDPHTVSAALAAV